MGDGSEEPRAPRGRLASLFLLAALTVAGVGFLTGASEEGPRGLGYRPARPLDPGAVVTAPAQRDLRTTLWGANAGMYEGAVPALGMITMPAGPPPPRSDQIRQTTSQVRATRRAYNGAPPTIPHAIDQVQAPSCLACHERGMQLAGKTAPVMSHRRFDGCIQCHVPAVPPFPLVETAPVENTFQGLTALARGERAWTGAPPTIPHPTLMREDCNSCHGPGGAFGLRTPHPERASCTQCHAPGALLDQRTTLFPPARDR